MNCKWHLNRLILVSSYTQVSMIYLNADGMPLSISSLSSADVMWICFVVFSLSFSLTLGTSRWNNVYPCSHPFLLDLRFVFGGRCQQLKDTTANNNNPIYSGAHIDFCLVQKWTTNSMGKWEKGFAERSDCQGRFLFIDCCCCHSDYYKYFVGRLLHWAEEARKREGAREWHRDQIIIQINPFEAKFIVGRFCLSE